MNEKITFPTLVQLLALATGDKKKESEDFVREFFSVISSALAEGETVKIKDFGVFKTVDVEERKSVNVATGEDNIIPPHRKVVFVPSREVAALVNAPFDMFETVELEEVTEDTSSEKHEEKYYPEDALNNEDELLNIEDDLNEEEEIIGSNANTSGETDLPDKALQEAAEEETETAVTKDNSAPAEIQGEDSASVYIYDEAEEQPEEDSHDAHATLVHAVESRIPVEESPGVEEDTPLIYEDDSRIADELPPAATDYAIEPTVVADSNEADNDTEVTAEQLKLTPEEEKALVEPSPMIIIKEDRISKEKKQKSSKSKGNKSSSAHEGGFGKGFAVGFVAALLSIVIVGCIFWIYQIPPFHKVLTGRVSEAEENNPAVVIPGDTADSVQEAGNEDEVPEEKTEIQTESPSKGESSVKKGESSIKNDPVPTEPSDKKVYDTISKTRFLTTMAKDHYGNFHLWPYIYMENASFLGHPDRIRPGTRVVIPPLSKYGVNPQSKADIDKAKKKGVEIYSRFK